MLDSVFSVAVRKKISTEVGVPLKKGRKLPHPVQQVKGPGNGVVGKPGKSRATNSRDVSRPCCTIGDL